MQRLAALRSLTPTPPLPPIRTPHPQTEETMSRRKKRARAEHSHDAAQAAATEEQVEESTEELVEEPAELPAHEHAQADEPTGFESEGLAPPITKVGPLA